jgi:hypothetical protein
MVAQPESPPKGQRFREFQTETPATAQNDSAAVRDDDDVADR